MPLLRAVPVMLSAGERTTLKKRVRGAKTAYRDRLRAQIVLAAARGRDNARIAADLRITVDTVRKWRGRFAGRGLDGLTDLPRSGRPRRISELTRAAVVALACQLPAATGIPLSRWTGPELLAEVTRAGAGGELSVSSVLRILAEHPVKPWQYQSWISPRDPDFAVRASVILDLYQGFYQGKRLRPGDRILSVDAKPSIQRVAAAAPPPRQARQAGARGARIPAQRLPRPAGRARRAYRQGVRLYRRDHRDRPVHGPDRPGHEPAAVQDAPRDSSSWTTAPTTAARPPSAAARRLAERHHDPYPGPRLLAESSVNLLLHHPEESHLAQRLRQPGHSPHPAAFVDRYNQSAQPFNWKFTAADLARLLDRISPARRAPKPAQLPEAA